MYRRTFVLCGAGWLLSAGAGATQDRRVFLGARTVRWNLDHDVIVVTAARAAFDHIRLLVKGNAIYVYDLDVIYSNGAPDHIPLRFRIEQGGWSRRIDLRGRDRFIRRVELTYRRPGNARGQARIELWGER
ncbi:hypothetical protein [Caulobacter sp.]|uniref:hypothetical protein n=1 Tax=Caulobacter sp. TaxID=78 RepID=UPI003BB0F822